MRTALILATAAISLMGCDKGGGKAAPSTGPGPGSAASGESANGPARKAGLWELARLRDGKPAEGASGGFMKICVDSKTDARMGALGNHMTQVLCPQQTSSRNVDGSWGFASTCMFGPGGTTKTTGVARGDFSSRYTVHAESDTTGSEISRLNGRHVTDLTASYEGPCPSDMSPGDVLLANGMKLNPEKMMGGAAASPAGGQ